MLDIDNTKVREQQIARLEQVRADARRGGVRGGAATRLREGAAGDGNLLALCIDAARARATVGEMSDAMEAVFGRHKAEIRSITGVYGSAFDGDDGLRGDRRRRRRRSPPSEGRRPRLLMAKMGQDGHDRGAKVVGTAFADIGFDVDFGPLFETPAEVARAAVENDVHVVGVSSQAAGHKTLVPQLIDELERAGGEDILVVCGGVIPPQDYDELRDAGVVAIFGPGTNIPDAAATVLDLLRARPTRAERPAVVRRTTSWPRPSRAATAGPWPAPSRSSSRPAPDHRAEAVGARSTRSSPAPGGARPHRPLRGARARASPR